MAGDEDIIVLIDLVIGVNVCAEKLGIAKCASCEVVALNKDIIVLIDCAVGIYVSVTAGYTSLLGLNGYIRSHAHRLFSNVDALELEHVADLCRGEYLITYYAFRRITLMAGDHYLIRFEGNVRRRADIFLCRNDLPLGGVIRCLENDV